MKYRTNFFKKVITSIYDIKVFAQYAKEGFFRSISYAMLLTLILTIARIIFSRYKIYSIGRIDFVSEVIINFGNMFFNLLFNCLIVATISSIFTIFMKMIVKYTALYSVTLYAATLPLIVKVVLETINVNINFDSMFIISTLTYVILIIKHIKDELIQNSNK